MLNQTPTVNSFQLLRQQWEQILAQPTVRQTWQAPVNQQFTSLQTAQIISLEETLSQTLLLLESAQIHLKDGLHKTRLMELHWLIIDRCYHFFDSSSGRPWELCSIKNTRR